MFSQIIIALLFLCILLPFGIFYITEARSAQRSNGKNRVSKFKRTLFGNIISFFAVLIFAAVFMFSGTASAASSETADMSAGLAYIAAAISTGLGSLAAGIATGSAASAALGALSENEGIMGKALIFVALAEGIAIYGLIIAFMILSRV